MIDGMFGAFFEVIGVMTCVFFVAWGISLAYEAIKNKKPSNDTETEDCPEYCVTEDLYEFKRSVWEYMDGLECRLDVLEEDINAALATKVSKKKAR